MLFQKTAAQVRAISDIPRQTKLIAGVVVSTWLLLLAVLVLSVANSNAIRRLAVAR